MPPPRLLLLFLVTGTIALKPPITTNFKCLANGCCDQHEWCRFWASIGECQANANWMKANCQLACNACPAHSTFLPPPNAPDPFAVATQRPINTNQNTFPQQPFVQTTQPPFNNFNTGPVPSASSCRSVDRARAAEVMITSRLINPNEDFSSRQTIALEEVTNAAANTMCVPQLTSGGNCDANLCYHLMYRSFDGTCNNLEKPLQGAAFRTYIRHFPAEYDDGRGEPVSSIRQTRPTAREANRVMLSSAQVVAHDKFNGMVMQWGQFMSHDMAKTTLQPTNLCKTCDVIPSKCTPIMIDRNDPNINFQQKQCLKVSRSAPVCGVVPREQLNENTAYIDGSMIYGSSPKDMIKFRDGRTGFLKMDEFNRQVVLPWDHAKCEPGTTDITKCNLQFQAGDVRANLFIGLTSLHILFAREHNRLARSLQMMNPTWSGDRVFQEARKIVGAEIQVILYKEWLPKVLGLSMEKVIGPYNGYKPNVDATISNEFTTSAFRFGHGMLKEFYARLDSSNNTIGPGGYAFGDGVFKSNKIVFEGGIDPILRGFMMAAVKRPHRMTPSITEKMFGSTDLGSLNIQRGRDHGIPSYNKLRQFCGFPAATDFEGFANQILDANLRKALEKNYKDPNNVDFYVGAMLEDPVVGGLVGSSLACLVGEQFKRSRDGDRFYFENPGVFTPTQLTEIRKTTLSRVICDNADRFEVISQDAFLQPGPQMTPCTALPRIELTPWRE